MDVLDVVGIAHEGQGDEIRADLEGPAQIVPVLLAQGGNGHGNPGKIEALVVGDVAGHLDLGDDVRVRNGHDTHRNIAVVDEEAVPGTAVSRQSLESRRDALDGAQDVVRGDGELITLVEHDLLVVHKGAQADLGALQVDEDRHGIPRGCGGVPHASNDVLLVLSASMGPVDAGDIHAGVHQRLHILRRIGGRPQGAYDLCSAHESSLHVPRRGLGPAPAEFGSRPSMTDDPSPAATIHTVLD